MNLLEVKEFDKIIGNPDYRNDSRYKYLEQPAFDDLIKFIKEFEATEENDDAYDCLKITSERGAGDVVSTKNYVGLIQMKNGYQVQILPKISMDKTPDENNRTTKNTFTKMLRCMDDFQSKIFSSANLNVDRMNLYEIFINMYIQAVDNLIKHGLKSNYINEDDNLSTLKGKLSVQQHITKNVAHKEKFYCEFDEYQLNRPENKLIKSTLLKLNDITENIENKKNINKQLNAFELVSPSTNYDMDFNKISIDRSMKDYEQVLNWSKIFLKNKSFTTFSGESVSRALLFPMDKLFEAYVGKNIKRIFGDEWNISLQDKGYYLFNDPEQFKLRPDIVLTNQKDSRIIIMDTKWKSLENNSRKNYGISQGDMYQMYAYAKKYKTPDIWLLYPVNDEMRNHEEIKFESFDDNGSLEAKVTLFFIDLVDIEKTLKELKSKL